MVGRYVMETRLPQIRCAVQVVAPMADPHAAPVAARLAGAIGGASLVEVPGGMVPFPNQMPEVFAETALAFLSRSYPP